MFSFLFVLITTVRPVLFVAQGEQPPREMQRVALPRAGRPWWKERRKGRRVRGAYAKEGRARKASGGVRRPPRREGAIARTLGNTV